MKKEIKYVCEYTSGDGVDYPEGQWEIKTLTKKTMIIEKISESRVYNNYEKGDRIRCVKGNSNPLTDWGDGTFTIYPKQAGTPYYFKPIQMPKNNPIKKERTKYKCRQCKDTEINCPLNWGKHMTPTPKEIKKTTNSSGFKEKGFPITITIPTPKKPIEDFLKKEIGVPNKVICGNCGVEDKVFMITKSSLERILSRQKENISKRLKDYMKKLCWSDKDIEYLLRIFEKLK